MIHDDHDDNCKCCHCESGRIGALDGVLLSVLLPLLALGMYAILVAVLVH